jgi:hypothetical protein
MSFGKAHMLMRKTRQSRGRYAEFFVINVTLATEQVAEFHTREVPFEEQRNAFLTLLYADFPELVQHVDLTHVSRQ